jgi:hypothetical protein
LTASFIEADVDVSPQIARSFLEGEGEDVRGAFAVVVEGVQAGYGLIVYQGDGKFAGPDFSLQYA